jgi:hypothetical protein
LRSNLNQVGAGSVLKRLTQGANLVMMPEEGVLNVNDSAGLLIF